MATERCRLPEGMRPPLGVAFSADATPLADLFTAKGAVDSAGPHPDFAARAAIWHEQREGLISFAEAQRRSALVGTIKPIVASLSGLKKTVRPRHCRLAPNSSRQYAREMATTAARDDRLTPNAKAFLQVLRARCGKGRETTITKGTAGNIMARSPRTIRRYLVDLVRFGYIELSTRCNAQGLHLGLTVKLTALALPFFEDAKSLARWLANTPAALFRPFATVFDPGKAGVTLLSPRNQTQIISSYLPLGRTVTNPAFAGKKLSNKKEVGTARFV